jgi:hypothetical protein
MGAEARNILLSARMSTFARVRQNSNRFGFGALGHFCALDPASAHYVKHDFAGGHEVVCDDATMALPPNCFGAHYCTRTLMPEIAESIKPTRNCSVIA